MKLLTTAEVMRILRIRSRTTLRRLRKLGKLEASFVAGGWKYTTESVERFLAATASSRRITSDGAEPGETRRREPVDMGT